MMASLQEGFTCVHGDAELLYPRVTAFVAPCKHMCSLANIPSVVLKQAPILEIGLVIERPSGLSVSVSLPKLISRFGLPVFLNVSTNLSTLYPLLYDYI